MQVEPEQLPQPQRSCTVPVVGAPDHSSSITQLVTVGTARRAAAAQTFEVYLTTLASLTDEEQ
jgi:hypothetical protein